MGRIKTQMIKRLTQKILNEYRTDLGKSFDGNKPVVAKHLSIKSKKLRNIVAGYATRLMKNDENNM